MTSSYQVLTDEQVEQFLSRGFVVINGCFTRAAAEEYTDGIWTRLGYSPDDQSTWAEPSIHMPSHRQIDIHTFAPKAWAAICDLVGGASRISTTRPHSWNDGFIVNLWEGGDQPWQPPQQARANWHKDGDFFRHFLDSPEQGLLTLVLWSDVRHQGGATFVAADSVAPVARFLADHPEGVSPLVNPAAHLEPDPETLAAAAGPGQPAPVGFPYTEIIAGCEDFVEATGQVGDVYLIHPFLLHAKGPNTLRVPRYITNPPISLAEPMCFDRPDPADYSLVERAVLRGLGVDRHPFTPTAEREELTPPRILRQQRMMAEEQTRLAASGRS